MNQQIKCLVSAYSGSSSKRSELLQAHVLGEIVVRPAVTLEAPANTLRLVSTGKDLREETLLRSPAGVSLWLAITPRHGVIKPAVRRPLVNVNLIALVVSFEGVA